MAIDNYSMKELVKEYVNLRDMLEGIPYSHLSGIGAFWNSELANIGSKRLSISDNDQKDIYLNQYIRDLEYEISLEDKDSITRIKKSLFRIYLIYYYSDHNDIEEFNELHRWLLDIFKADVRADMMDDNDEVDTSHIQFRIIKGGEKD